MTAIADLVSHLLSTGLSADAVARAVDLAQQHANESADIRRQSADNPPMSALDRRRAYDRERQREKRISAKHASTLLPSSSLSDSQESKKVIVARSRGSRLPADWTPSNADACFALPLVGDPGMTQEVLKFRDYWHARAGPGGVKLDWSATWRNWIRNSKNGGKINGHGSSTMDAFDRIIAGTGGEIADDPPMRDITPRGS